VLEKIQNHIKSRFPFLENSKLLIAISGGMDSVVLTHLCHKMKLNFALVHCNFNLRGEESDADEDFVLQLAEDLNLEVFIENFDTETYAKTHKLSTQMAARELRYSWFNDLMDQLHFDYLLTAHHADDNLETFLINLSRGTGLEGLTGIPEINGTIVRPLLTFSRQELEAYAIENKMGWREDSSNMTTKYLRNKIRHDVIPALKEANPQVLQNFNKTLSFLQDSYEIIEDRIAEIQKKVVSVEDDLVTLDIKKLQKLYNPKAYLYQLLKDFNFTEWDDVTALLKAQSGKQIFSETHRLLKDRETLILSKRVTKNDVSIRILENETQSDAPFGILQIEDVDKITTNDFNSIYVDKHLLKFPLKLRKWIKGDYFYPFGMQGKKKLSKYFKDEKLSLIDKENVWLLCSEDDIVWIINRRADNRFKVTEKTNQILKIINR
jgi:tRNA(Ile)-lysidine synthase